MAGKTRIKAALTNSSPTKPVGLLARIIHDRLADVALISDVVWKLVIEADSRDFRKATPAMNDLSTSSGGAHSRWSQAGFWSICGDADDELRRVTICWAGEQRIFVPAT
jgi:hypothetical protein